MITQDARYAIRSLGRAPGFTAVALVTLALGIGATTAIFSVVDGILLRPLPYPEPDAIVTLSRVTGSTTDGSFAAADFLDYQRRSRSLSAIAGYRQEVVDLNGRGEPLRLVSLETTAAFFDVFGLPPLAGRTYSAVDAREGSRVTVISEATWRQHFGAAADVVGSTIRLNGVPMTIIGIMPAPFVHPSRVDLWVMAPREVPSTPLTVDGDLLANRDVQYFQAIGRIQRGLSLEQANADLRNVGARLAQEFPDTNASESVIAEPLHETLVGDVRSALIVLLAAVGFVLLIACANVASLLLARGAGRRREIAIRKALGASRRRLVVQLLTESLLLAMAGGLAGLLLAYWGIDALVALAPRNLPRIREVALDPRVATFALLTTAAVGVLFGLAPAFQSSREDANSALKDGGRGGTARTGMRSALVVIEVALSLVLLIGAGLMLTSFAKLRAVDPGFDVDDLTAAYMFLPQSRYDRDAQARFYQQLHERLQENPATQRTALALPTPFGGFQASGAYRVEGVARERGQRPIAQMTAVSPGFFQTMGIPLLRGRDVSYSDRREAPVVVVNRTLAEREWPGQDPIGRRLSMGADDDPNAWATIVGVVGDSIRSNLQAGPQPSVYLPLTQFTLPFMGVIIRSELDEAALTTALRTAARPLDPELPVGDMDRISELVARATGEPRFRAVLTGAFAIAALVLAAVGLYGLISYTVAQRTPEIGVRLALGASPTQVGRLVVTQGLRLAAAGVGLGLIGAVAAARLLEGLLFSISATDPRVYAGLAVLLLAIAALASYVPARRAMRVNPLAALRAE